MPIPQLLRLARPIVDRIWRGGTGARLSILIYHRVLEQADPLQPSIPVRGEFQWQMRMLRMQFNPLPLGEAIRRLYAGELPPRSVCVTFDDGYADNLSVAAEVLQAEAVPATFFVSTGYLNGGRMWNDTVIETVRRLPEGRHDLSGNGLPVIDIDSGADSRRRSIDSLLSAIKHLDYERRLEVVDWFAERCGGELPTDLMMTDGQVRELSGPNAEIGAHTLTHPILTRVAEPQAREEIRAGKAYLENLLQTEVSLFAYPNGKPTQDYTREHAEMVREAGFEAAVSTAWGVSTGGSDRFQLPRFTPWDRQPTRFYARLVHNCLRTETQTA